MKKNHQDQFLDVSQPKFNAPFKTGIKLFSI